MSYFFIAAYVVGCIAASISAVASASRVLYGMGEGTDFCLKNASDILIRDFTFLPITSL